MLIYRAQVQDLSAHEYKALASLNMRGDGTMLGRLRQCRRGELKGRVVVAEDRRMVLGWALVFWPGLRPRAAFYVRASHRRQGIGTRIAKEVEHWYGPVDVWSWREEAALFFDRFDGLVQHKSAT